MVRIDLRAFGGSALTADIEVPKDSLAPGIPITYVPARNTIFLSYAMAWAEVLECSDIFIGVNAIDYSGYPDCRPEFIAAFEHMANLATKAGRRGADAAAHSHAAGAARQSRDREAGERRWASISRSRIAVTIPMRNGRSVRALRFVPAAAKGIREAGLRDPLTVSRMKISEIFYSIQGEGMLTGVPSVFVRTSGCNLRCVWCDTPYTSWTPEGADMTVEEILAGGASASRQARRGHRRRADDRAGHRRTDARASGSSVCTSRSKPRERCISRSPAT